MKRSLYIILVMFFLAVASTGCVTTSDLEQVQAQQKLNAEKTDQAIKDAQNAKATADAAVAKANEDQKRAEDAIKAAEEKARLAEEKAASAEAKAAAAEEKAAKTDEKVNNAQTLFQKSMKK
jgi:murein lipoprotein